MPAHLFRRLLPVALGLCCFSLPACKSASGSKKPGYSGVVDYTTPETNLSQEEYPFDEKGNYLPDVVSGKKKGRTNKSAPQALAATTYERPPEPALAASVPANYETPPESSPSQPETSSGSTASAAAAKPAASSSSKTQATRTSTASSKPKPKPKATASKATASKPKPKAKAKPAPAKPTTLNYTVKKGDTLYGLAERFHTSVAAIKKASGLTSNALRNGRTLRIPRK